MPALRRVREGDEDVTYLEARDTGKRVRRKSWGAGQWLQNKTQVGKGPLLPTLDQYGRGICGGPVGAEYCGGDDWEIMDLNQAQARSLAELLLKFAESDSGELPEEA